MVTCGNTGTGMSGIIDVHAHILPAVDDGSRSVEETLRLITSARDQGITAIIATPHYSRRQDNSDLVKLTEQLNISVREQYPDFFIYTGQETYYHEELPERLQKGKALTLAGSRYVLVEFDPGVSWQTLYRGIRQLGSAAYIPVLAHMERYICLHDEDHVDELISCGCRMQMNYESLTGRWYQAEPRWCRKQVQERKIHLLGTDMHRMDYRPPQIAAAVRWLERNISPGYLDRLTRKNAQHILNHEAMD